MDLWERCLTLLGLRTPIAVHDPAVDEGRAPAPGQLQSHVPPLEPSPPDGGSPGEYPGQADGASMPLNRVREVWREAKRMRSK